MSTVRITQGGDDPHWSKAAFEALKLGHLYREEGEPVPAPAWVIEEVVKLRGWGRVNMLSPELVSYFADNGNRDRNPALWILEHRDQYVAGIQHGFVVEPDQEKPS